MNCIESRLRDIEDGHSTPDVAWLCATLGELLMRERQAFDAGLEVGAVLCEAQGYVDTAGEIRSFGSGEPL
jgi:hypothetical protein